MSQQSRISKIAVVMGSQSDWPVMQHAVEQLEAFGVEYEARVVSAHRTPDLLFEFAGSARANGFAVIICGCRWCCSFTWYAGRQNDLARTGCACPLKIS